MRSSSRLLYCTAALLLCAPALAPAQQAAAPAATAYTTFMRGTPVGREDVTVRRDAGGLVVSSEGRVSFPANLTFERAEFRYAPDGSPQAFEVAGSTNGAPVSIRTTVANGSARTETVQAAAPIAQTIGAQSLLHANGIVGSYVALAYRLGETAPGSSVRVFVVPQTEIDVRLLTVQNDRMQLGASFLNARRYEIVFGNPGNDVAATITTDGNANLLTVRIPSQGLDIVRADLASTTTRMQVHSNPGDEPATIPAPGFNLGATLTRPKSATAGGRFPAVILLSGTGSEDRDGYLVGIPVIGQLAGALAEAGFLTVRYDKRGFGQSGGRSESATITDYADDARTVMRWLADRKDVDPKRIALIGHAEGAWVALLAASREKRFAAIATIAAPSGTGSEMVLEQQQFALDQLNLSPEEREKRIALQKQIATAVKSGKGVADLPPNVRQQADTPWFQSLLNFLPAKVLEDVRQPVLIVHGGLDKQMPPAHADRLAELARNESDSESIEVAVIKPVNHLLVPAVTGDVSEYGALTDRNVSADVSMTIASWLTRTFAAVK